MISPMWARCALSSPTTSLSSAFVQAPSPSLTTRALLGALRGAALADGLLGGRGLLGRCRLLGRSGLLRGAAFLAGAFLAGAFFAGPPSSPAPSWPAPSSPAPSWPGPSSPGAFFAGAAFLAGAFLAGAAFFAGAAFLAGAFFAGAPSSPERPSSPARPSSRPSSSTDATPRGGRRWPLSRPRTCECCEPSVSWPSSGRDRYGSHGLPGRVVAARVPLKQAHRTRPADRPEPANDERPAPGRAFVVQVKNRAQRSSSPRIERSRFGAGVSSVLGAGVSAEPASASSCWVK